MREIAKHYNPDTHESVAPETLASQYEVFPDEIKSLLRELPDSLQQKLFVEKENIFEDNETSAIEELIANFDQETRESYFEYCLAEVFQKSEFSQRLHSTDNTDLELEIERFLNAIWNNRDTADDIEAYSTQYYTRLLDERQKIIDKVTLKKQEIEQMRQDKDNTRKQKRLTEQKNTQIAEEQQELESLLHTVEAFDKQHRNGSVDVINNKDIRARRKNEIQWTKVCARICNYFGATEFATAIAAAFDREFIRENEYADDNKRETLRRSVSDAYIEKSKQIAQALPQAIEKWSQEHRDEGVLGESKKIQSEQRQNTLINYFIALADSYIQGRNSQQSDEHMLYTIRQMEITLRLLSK